MAKSQNIKRAFISVLQHENRYMLFRDDIRKIYKVRKFKAPALPPYDGKSIEHEDEEDTCPQTR